MGKTSNRVSALVLPVEAAASGDVQTVAGFPGRWMPGEPVALSALEMDEATARKLIRDLNLPLEVVRSEEGEARSDFRQEGHAPSAPYAAPHEAAAEPEDTVTDTAVVSGQTEAPDEPVPDEPGNTVTGDVS